MASISKNFVVRHGFEVSTDLILADAETRRVGISSLEPQYTLDVAGGIGATDFYLTGVGTFITELNVGSDGNLLTVIGTGNSTGVGIGTNTPAYLLDLRSSLSTGQTSVYIEGDVRIVGNVNSDSIDVSAIETDNINLININATGVGTFGNLYVPSSGIATIGVGIVTTLRGTNLNYSGIGTINDLRIGTQANKATISYTTNTARILTIPNVDGDRTFSFINQNQSYTGIHTFQQIGITSGSGNFTGLTTFSSVDINGGTIDGVSIGVNARGIGYFTQLDAAGNVILGGNTSDQIALNGKIISNIIPNDNNSYDLGSSSFQWKNLYVDGLADLDDVVISGTLKDQNGSVGVANSILASTVTGVKWVNSSEISQNAAGPQYSIQINNGGGQFNGFSDLLFYWDQSPKLLSLTGNLSVNGTVTSSGNLSVTTGNITVGSGNVTLSSGNLSVIGNITSSGITSSSSLRSGDISISSGIITATSGVVTYFGDGSKLTNLPAGLGTALSQDQSNPLNRIYYTNQVLSIASTITVDPPSSAIVAYTQYPTISVESGADLIIADGDEFIPDILGIGTTGTVGTLGGGGRIRADNFSDKAGTGAPSFNAGLNVVGVVTASIFSGTATTAIGAQGLVGTPNITVGVITATRFIVPGGQTNQFLKANGTLDNKEYSTKQTQVAMSIIFGY